MSCRDQDYLALVFLSSFYLLICRFEEYFWFFPSYSFEFIELLSTPRQGLTPKLCLSFDLDDSIARVC